MNWLIFNMSLIKEYPIKQGIWSDEYISDHPEPSQKNSMQPFFPSPFCITTLSGEALQLPTLCHDLK